MSKGSEEIKSLIDEMPHDEPPENTKTNKRARGTNRWKNSDKAANRPIVESYRGFERSFAKSLSPTQCKKRMYRN